VTLAKTAKLSDDISGWLISEKLDGTRCLWDGGITRGMPTDMVPWAGVLDPKDPTQRKKKIKPVSTGLWSRYGNPIIAPDWFVEKLPPVMLDGELWAGRGNFQRCRSIVSGDSPDPRWDEITFKVYGAPPLETLTLPGLIKGPQHYCEVREEALQDMLVQVQSHAMRGQYAWVSLGMPFESALQDLDSYLACCSVAEVHLQRFLPTPNAAAWDAATSICEELVAAGAEGVIIRNPKSTYEVKRTKNLLKLKPVEDGEGTLVAFTAGKGKYEGMIGNLVLDFGGKRLEVGSGLNDDEREVLTRQHLEPGTEFQTPETPYFKLGQRIEFMYRELTDAGIPKEARYKRGGTNEQL
jgi:DNA ligase-1